MPKLDPDKNPIRQILEESNQPVFEEADRDVFQAIASYHNVPYISGMKPEAWGGYKISVASDDEEEPTPEEIAKAFEEEQAGIPASLIPSDFPPGFDEEPVDEGGEITSFPWSKDKLPLAVNVDPSQMKGVIPGIDDSLSTRPMGAPATEKSLSGGGSAFGYVNIENPEGGHVVHFINGKAVSVERDPSGFITSIDGIGPDNADQLSEQQIAAAMILANRSKEEFNQVKLGPFLPAAANLLKANPNFADQVEQSIQNGFTSGRAVTESVEGKQDFPSYVMDELLADRNAPIAKDEETQNEMREVRKLDLSDPEAIEMRNQIGAKLMDELSRSAEAGAQIQKEIQEGRASVKDLTPDELTMLNAFKYLISLRQGWMGTREQDTSETSGDYFGDGRTGSVYGSPYQKQADHHRQSFDSQPVINPVPLAEEPGYPEESIENQLEEAPSAVGHGEAKQSANEFTQYAPKSVDGKIPGYDPSQPLGTGSPYHLYTEGDLYGSHKDPNNKDLIAGPDAWIPNFGPGMPHTLPEHSVEKGYSVSQPVGYDQVNRPVALSPLQQNVPPAVLEQWKGSKIGAGDKHDNPSPKAAEEVFKALEEGDHDSAHHWMKQTDCPMGCEAQSNEGVCKHGYMSAGRTRVVFLDKDIRRGNVHKADFWDSLGNAAERTLPELIPGGQVMEGIGNALGFEHPWSQTMQQGAENIGNLFNAISGPDSSNPGNAPAPGSPEYNHLMDARNRNQMLQDKQKEKFAPDLRFPSERPAPTGPGQTDQYGSQLNTPYANGVPIDPNTRQPININSPIATR